MLETYQTSLEQGSLVLYTGKAVLGIDTELILHQNSTVSSNSATCSSSESSPLAQSYRQVNDGRSWYAQLMAVRNLVCAHKISILLYLIPLGILSHYLQWRDAYTFVINFLILIPLACILSEITEELASHTSELVGGIVNATFGNVVEVVVAILALRKGEVAVVQASLIGSVISNLLLVLGSAFVAGGSLYKEFRFSSVGATANAVLLILASFASLLPTYIFNCTFQGDDQIEKRIQTTLTVSRIAALLLLFIYAQFLVFQLYTHSEVFQQDEPSEAVDISLSRRTSVLALFVLTVMITYFSELLVCSVDGSTKSTQVSKSFIGIVLLPIVGNAVEHITAIKVAMHGKMELAVGISVGSATQVSFFVMPIVITAGWLMDQPLTLAFPMYETLIWVISVLIVYGVIANGTSNWLGGSILLTAYALISITAFWLPLSA